MKDYTITRPDGTKEDVDLECWKRWQAEYEESLRNPRTLYRGRQKKDNPEELESFEEYTQAGFSQDDIDSVDMPDLNKNELQDINVINNIPVLGRLPTNFPDVRGLALTRWLIRNSGDRNNYLFEKQKDKLISLRVAGYTRVLLEEKDVTEQKLKKYGGRQKGAVSANTNYINSLMIMFPKETAKCLYARAVDEADTDKSPFGKEEEELWDKEKSKIFPLKTFQNRMSQIKKSR